MGATIYVDLYLIQGDLISSLIIFKYNTSWNIAHVMIMLVLAGLVTHFRSAVLAASAVLARDVLCEDSSWEYLVSPSGPSISDRLLYHRPLLAVYHCTGTTPSTLPLMPDHRPSLRYVCYS